MLFLSLSRFGVDWLQLPSGKLLRTQQILSPSPPPTPFFVFRFNLCLLFSQTQVYHFLSNLPPLPALSLTLTLSLFLTSLQLNLFFFHPSSASAVQWETNWGRDTSGWLPLSLSLELIAVLQSVWFDFICAICLSNVTFGVWLELRHKPNWGILLSSCCCHSHRAGNKDLAAIFPPSLYFFL